MNKTYLRIGLPVGLAAVIAGVLLAVFLPGGDKAPSPEATTASTEATGEAGTAESKPSTATSTEQTATPTAESSADAKSGGETTVAAVDQAGTAGTEQPAATPERAKPSFDVVRINPKGGTVMAGRAEPGAEIIITDGDRELGRVKANERGEWVFTQEAPLAPGDRQLSLKDPAAGGAWSEQVVVLSVPEAKPGAEGQALAVLQPRDGGPSVVLQLPEEQKPSPGGVPQTSVDSVDYSDQGEIVVAGSTAPGAQLNIYLDNQLAGRVQADEQGRWSFAPGDALGEGPHQLRVDSVDSTGKVIARAETPIARSPPEKLALAGETLVIVQPGNSLWRIARRTYGGGVHYVDIFQANRHQIRDPDLIYPGQIFSVPPLS